MPIDLDTQLTRAPVPREPVMPEDTGPGFVDTLPAAFRQYNATYNLAQMIAEEFVEPEADPNFNPYEGVDGTIFDRYPDALLNVESWEERELVRMKLHEEEEDRETIAASGGVGIAASMAAGMIDPLFLLPFGPAASGARAAVVGSESVVRGVLRGGAISMRAGFIGASAAELALQANQEIRSLGEGIVDISAATLLSGVLGAGAGGISKALMRQATRDTDRILGGSAFAKSDPSVHIDDLMSDAANGTNKTEIKVAKGFKVPEAAALMKMDPFLDVVTHSPTQSAKRGVMQLVEPTVRVEGFDGPAAVYSKVRLWEAQKGGLKKAERALYKKYKKRRAKEGRVAMSRLEFYDNAGSSQRLGQIEGFTDQGRVLVEPEAAELATMHNEVYNNIAQDMISLKMLPEDVIAKGPTGAASYLKRRYLVDKITSAAERNADGSLKFQTRIWNWLQRTLSDEERAAIIKKHGGMDPEAAISLEIDEASRSILATVTGRAEGQNIIDGPGFAESSPFKKRVLSWDDEDVLEYLDNNISTQTEHYINTVIPRLELHKLDASYPASAKSGDPSHRLPRMIQAVRDEYDEIKEGVIGNPAIRNKDKEFKRLDKLEKRDLEVIEAFRDRLLGTYRTKGNHPKAAKAARIARRHNLLAQGGQFVQSSIPDVGMPVFRNGLTRTLGTATFAPLRHVSYRAAKRELEHTGAVFEHISNTRFLEMTDIGTEVGSGWYDQLTGKLASNFSRINMLSQWNQFWKDFAGVTSQSRIVDTVNRIADGKKVRRSDLADLRHLRINDSMARRIAAQLALPDGAGSDGPLKWGNSSNWTDDGARTAYRTAIGQSIDDTILTPGVGDRPLFMSTELGKTIGQYKSFSMAATSRLLVQGAQKLRAGELRAVNGLIMMILAGGVAENVKRAIAGKEIQDDPTDIFFAGLDRSGTMGILSDPIHILEKMGVGILPGGPMSSRFAARNITSSLAGPSFGLLESVIRTGSATAQGWTEGDVENAMRLIPYQNLFWWRAILGKLPEQAVVEATGVPQSRSN